MSILDKGCFHHDKLFVSSEFEEKIYSTTIDPHNTHFVSQLKIMLHDSLARCLMIGCLLPVGYDPRTVRFLPAPYSATLCKCCVSIAWPPRAPPLSACNEPLVPHIQSSSQRAFSSLAYISDSYSSRYPRGASRETAHFHVSWLRPQSNSGAYH